MTCHSFFSLIGLIGSLQLCGCATAIRYQNVAQPKSAQIWIGQDGGKGLWSAEPGNAALGIYKLDGMVAGFPPTLFIGFGSDYSKPLYLVPGAHSIALNFEHYFSVQTSPTELATTVTYSGSGTIMADFLPSRQYHITAFFSEGKFSVTLWDVTGVDMPGHSLHVWEFDSYQSGGTPYGFPPRKKRL